VTRSSIWKGTGADGLSRPDRQRRPHTLAGRELDVGIALGARLDHAADLDAVLVAQIMRARGGQSLVSHHHLNDARGIAKIRKATPP
jgi:hypothetical protein